MPKRRLKSVTTPQKSHNSAAALPCKTNMGVIVDVASKMQKLTNSDATRKEVELELRKLGTHDLVVTFK